MQIHPRTIFVVGHARLPQGMAAKTQYDTLALTTQVDRRFGVITSASCSLVLDHTRDYVTQLLVGYSLLDGVEELCKDLERYYFGAARNALIAAIRDLGRKFEELREKTEYFSGK